MKLTGVMLREMTLQITRGNPFWGMLLANEYLHKGDHLRKALVTRFAARMKNIQAQHQRSQVNELTQQLIAGATADKLSDELMRLVGPRLICRYKYPMINSKIPTRPQRSTGSLIRPRRTAPQRFRELRRNTTAMAGRTQSPAPN